MVLSEIGRDLRLILRALHGSTTGLVKSHRTLTRTHINP
jgi:hypothetical protein